MEDINNQDPTQEPQKPTQEPIENKTVEEPAQEEKAPREPKNAPDGKSQKEPLPGIASLFSQVTDEAQKFEQRLKEEYQQGFDPSVEEEYRPPSGEEVIIPGRTYEQTMPGGIKAAAQQLEPGTVQRTYPEKRERLKDYVEGTTPFGMLEHLLTSKDFTKDHLGYDREFHNIDSYITMRVREDAAELKAAGIPFDIEEEQRSITAELYIDTMFALGMPLFTPGPNVSEDAWKKYVQHMLNDEAFVNYVNSEEGFAEIEKGMSLLKRVRARGGAQNLTEEDMELLPYGAGAPDPSLVGLTEEEYSQRSIWDKTKYNWTAARTTFSEHTLGAFGYEADVQFREGVAPIGDAAGYIASWLVPFKLIGKGFQLLKGTSRGAQLISKLPKLKPWQADMMRGAVVDMLLARTNEENLSSILEEHLDPTTASGALVHALAREEDENTFIAMMKDGIEGAILDRGVAGILLTTKFGYKTAKKAAGKVGRAGRDVFMLGVEAANRRVPVTRAGRQAKKVREAQNIVDDILIKGEDNLEFGDLGELARTGEVVLQDAKSQLEKVVPGDDPLIKEIEGQIEQLRQAAEDGDAAAAFNILKGSSEAVPAVSDKKVSDAWTKLKEAVEDYQREPSSEARKAEVESAYYRFLKEADVQDEASRKVVDSVPDIKVRRRKIREKVEPEDQITVPVGGGEYETIAIENATKSQLENYIIRVKKAGEKATKEGRELSDLSIGRMERAEKALAELEAGRRIDSPQFASDNDIKEWRRRQRTSNRKDVGNIVELVKGYDDPYKFMKDKRGKNLVTKPVGTAVSLANDIRVNNILWSMGVSSLALVSGVFTKGIFMFEQGAGRLARSVRWLTRSGRKKMGEEFAEREMLHFTYETVKEGADVKWPTFFNMAYVLSGGTITPQDSAMDIIRKVGQGLLQPSRPSRLDPAYQAQSETGRTVAARGSQDGIDISGRSRLAELAANAKSEDVRDVANFFVSLLEFMPRTVLGTIDEGLKTGTYFKEFSDNLYRALSNELGKTEVTGEQIYLFHAVILDRVYKVIEEKGIPLDFDAFMLEAQDDLLRAAAFDAPITDAGFSIFDLAGEIAEEEGSEAAMKFLRQELDKTIEELKPGQLEDILREAHRGATQRARQVTLTQDVPEMFEGVLRGLQSNWAGRAFSPFTRSIINALTMGIERVPFIQIFRKKFWVALKGKEGAKEAERAWGKMISGTSLMGLGVWLGLKDEDGIHIQTTDMGSWNKTTLRVPVSDPQNDADFKEGIERYYIENKDYLDKANEVINGENAKDTLQWLLERADSGVTEGYIDIDISRVGPWSTLINLAAIFAEANLGNNNKTVKEIENDKGFWEGFEILNRFVEENGLADPLKLFVNALEDPVGAGKIFAMQYVTDVISPFKGMLSSPGEPFSPDYVPRNTNPKTLEELWDKAMSTHLFARLGRTFGLAEKPAKQRDFLGRPLMGKERYGYLVGYETAIDPISRELEFFGIRKRPTAPNEVPYFAPYDLREFDVMEIPEELVEKYGLQDTTDAYDVYQVLIGTVSDRRGNSAISEFNSFFESEEYKELKRAVEIYAEGDFNETELRTYAASAELSHNAVSRIATRITTAYKNLAAEVMFEELSPFLKDGNGMTLSQASAEAEAAMMSGAEALDRILEGGNK